MNNFIETIKNSDNVYRTKKHIVAQEISFEVNACGENRIFSNDTYFVRNKKIDKEFEFAFKDRKFINGKRVHSTIYVRHYIV